jgi:hypothetical protein
MRALLEAGVDPNSLYLSILGPYQEGCSENEGLLEAGMDPNSQYRSILGPYQCCLILKFVRGLL